MNLYNAQFTIGNVPLRYFWHAHNCGFPDDPRTERVIELAIADYWLQYVENVVEVGAVTPYYWPHRVRVVIDPADPHPLVCARLSVFNIAFNRADVLSISTVEHIGTGQYLDEPNVSGLDALQKILDESNRMLVAFGAGQNKALDNAVYNGNADTLCNVYFMVRNPDQTWRQVEKAEAWRRYGPWANSVAILEKGGVFNGTPSS